jgi:hypothetical protein
MQDGEQRLSSFSHLIAASTISSAKDEKAETSTNFSQEKSKNDDNFRIDNSNINKRARFNRMLPFRCHFCKLAFGNNSKRTKHGHAWHSNSNAKDRKTTIHKC